MKEILNLEALIMPKQRQKWLQYAALHRLIPFIDAEGSMISDCINNFGHRIYSNDEEEDDEAVKDDLVFHLDQRIEVCAPI
mmetsp:Transcript_2157/g.2624  ORF Transcript_2157/g.2624 Transcript_2157/m.2624 type:complete len:81 (-) Transcript_2157:578-820(-)